MPGTCFPTGGNIMKCQYITGLFIPKTDVKSSITEPFCVWKIEKALWTPILEAPFSSRKNQLPRFPISFFPACQQTWQWKITISKEHPPAKAGGWFHTPACFNLSRSLHELLLTFFINYYAVPEYHNDKPLLIYIYIFNYFHNSQFVARSSSSSSSSSSSPPPS